MHMKTVHNEKLNEKDEQRSDHSQPKIRTSKPVEIPRNLIAMDSKDNLRDPQSLSGRNLFGFSGVQKNAN